MTPVRWAVAGSLVLAGLGVVWTAGPYLHAERMLDASVVPPGSVQVFFLPGGVFAQPSQEPACAPLIDQTRYWMVPGDPQHIASFLQAHAPPGIPNEGVGQLSTTGGQTISYDVIDAALGKSGALTAELDFTVAALGAGMAGIRADAEVVAADATCTYSGGPAPRPRRQPTGTAFRPPDGYPDSAALPRRHIRGTNASTLADTDLRGRIRRGPACGSVVHLDLLGLAVNGDSAAAGDDVLGIGVTEVDAEHQRGAGMVLGGRGQDGVPLAGGVPGLGGTAVGLVEGPRLRPGPDDGGESLEQSPFAHAH